MLDLSPLVPTQGCLWHQFDIAPRPLLRPALPHRPDVSGLPVHRSMAQRLSRCTGCSSRHSPAQSAGILQRSSSSTYTVRRHIYSLHGTLLWDAHIVCSCLQTCSRALSPQVRRCQMVRGSEPSLIALPSTFAFSDTGRPVKRSRLTPLQLEPMILELLQDHRLPRA